LGVATYVAGESVCGTPEPIMLRNRDDAPPPGQRAACSSLNVQAILDVLKQVECSNNIKFVPRREVLRV